MTWKDKLKNPFKRKTTRVDAPSQWVTPETAAIPVTPPKAGTDMVSLELVRHRKRRIPGLRRVNQLLAVLLLVANFFISQAALMSMTPSVGLMFLGNAYIILWGLWKSRKEPKTLENLR